jgi:signal transduction histidine kinase
MRLVRKLVLAIFLAFLPVIGAIEYLTIVHELRLSEEDTRRDLAVLGRVLQGEIERNWEAHHDSAGRHAISAANGAEPAARARWIPVNEPEPAPDAMRIEVRIPVNVDGVRRGTLALSESRTRLQELVRARVLRLTALTVALLAVSLAIAFTLGRRLVGARLASLVEHARRIGSSDLAGRLDTGGKDEIAALAVQMNAMTEELSIARTTVENANAERVQALSQLRHADRLASIGRLASALAHELGTPLNVVLGRAKLITEGESDPDAAAKNAEIIREQAQRMTETIRGVLGFARRAPGPPGRVDLGEIASQGLALLEPLARRRSVTLVLHRAEGPLPVSGQRGEIEQIVANLVTNAIDAMEHGGAVTIEVSTVSGKTVSRPVRSDLVLRRLSIRDEGPGVAAAELAQVFEPFYTTKSEGHGTGLGLWIVDGIVRDHGGWIEVESEPGKGACFSVYLPAAPE